MLARVCVDRLKDSSAKRLALVIRRESKRMGRESGERIPPVPAIEQVNGKKAKCLDRKQYFEIDVGRARTRGEVKSACPAGRGNSRQSPDEMIREFT